MTSSELIVQFRGASTAGVDTLDGKFAIEILDEYARNFQARNPNLRVINQIMHNDESSPHLHINFVPFYTEEKKIGMSKGVSLKSALIEQGFVPQGMKLNQLVLWENSEMKVLEDILNGRGIELDVKNAKHKHQSIPEYKASKDWKKLPRRKKNLSTLEVYHEHLQQSQEENAVLKVENDILTIERNSPYKSFYFSDPDKQSFVQSKLDELSIPYRESENGIEAKSCYVEQIRRIEKQFKPNANSHRDTLQNHLDMIIIQSKTFDEILERLKQEGYSVKHGEYISVKPKHYASGYIRLKSLGGDYSEQGIKNRLVHKQRFENHINDRISVAENEGRSELKLMNLKTIRHYTVVFAQGFLPVHKFNKKKYFSWSNCEELDRLAILNKKINDGITVESLRNDFAALEKSVAEKEEKLDILKDESIFFDKLYKAGVRRFENGGTDMRDFDLLSKNEITAGSYYKIPNLIADNDNEIAEIEQSLLAERQQFKDVSDTLTAFEKILSGTYVQSLMDDEKQRRQSDYIKNGSKDAGTNNMNLGGFKRR